MLLYLKFVVCQLRLHTRFEILHTWAEHQGLELAAECHMDRIQQAITLLITPKTMDNITSLGVTCYKLNSVQVFCGSIFV